MNSPKKYSQSKILNTKNLHKNKKNPPKTNKNAPQKQTKPPNKNPNIFKEMGSMGKNVSSKEI